MKKIFTLLIAVIICNVLSAQIVTIPDANFKTVLTSKICADFDGDGILDGDVDTNDDGEIQVSEAELVVGLKAYSDYKESFFIRDITGIEQFLSVKNIDLKILPNDNVIYDFSKNKKIEVFKVSRAAMSGGNDEITTLKLGVNENIKHIEIVNTGGISRNEIRGDFELKNYPNLEYFKMVLSNKSILDFSENTLIKAIEISERNTSSFPLLECKVKLGNHPNLETINISNIKFNPEFNELNLETSSKLAEVSLKTLPNVKKIILRNGSVLSSENLDFSGNNDLEFICVDEGEIAMIKNKANEYNYENLLVSSDCNADSDKIIDFRDANFKTVLISKICADFDGDGILDGDVDTNDDGEVQVSEAESVIELGGEFIKEGYFGDIVGLEFFVNLKRLSISVDTEKSKLNSFDFYNNNLLEFLLLNYNGAGPPSNFNFGTLSNLKELIFSKIDTAPRFMNSLWFAGMPNLEIFKCNGGILFYDLDFSENPLLKIIDINIYNYWTKINLGDKPYLEEFILEDYYVDDFTNQTLDLSRAPNLKKIVIKGEGLFNLNLKNGNTSDIENLVFEGSLNGACVDEEEIEVMKALCSCTVNTYCSSSPGGENYILSGYIRLDTQENGCELDYLTFDSMKFSVTKDGEKVDFISNGSGDYKMYLPAGEYSIEPVLEYSDYYTITPENSSVNFPEDGKSVIQNFCITPKGEKNDLEVIGIPLGDARPGFEASYKIVYKNNGSTIMSGSVDFSYNDNYVDFISSSPEGINQNNQKITFDFDTLLPLEKREIIVVLKLNTPTVSDYPLNDGDMVHFGLKVFPLENDETSKNNIFTLCQEVVNSHDPNDKRCLEGITITPENIGEYVHYMIRFENTGTASAINIIVKDEIDESKFDISSLIPLEGSHDFNTRINNNTAEFVFENINLPFDDANNDGYITFKIKTLSSLKLGDTFTNGADIYFDYNFPIVTNKAITKIEEPLSVLRFNNKTNINLYPNPVSTNLNIVSKTNIQAIQIIDITGKVLLKQVVNKKEELLVLNSLKAGIYFLRLKTEIGTVVKKIIKE